MIVKAALESYRTTGHGEISLLSLSTSDYPYFEERVKRMHEVFTPLGVSISLPSLRINHQLRSLPQLIKGVRKAGLTLAPEVARDDMREQIRKKIKNEDLYEGCREAFKNGWTHVKLYFLCGLPGEGAVDLDGIVDMAETIGRISKEATGRYHDVTASVANFVPKPHTPYQWNGMQTRDYFRWAHRYLRERKRIRNVQVKCHSVETSLLEGALSRGDRRMADAIELRGNLHAMVRIAGRAIPRDFGEDRRPAGFGMAALLQDKHPGPLAEDEAFAVEAERPRGPGGVVPGAGRDETHPLKGKEDTRRDGRISPAGQHHRDDPAANQRCGVANRIGAARAAGRDHMADAVQLERDRDLAGHHPDDRHRDRVGGHALPAVAEELGVLTLGDVDAARAAADDHAGVRLVEAEPRIRPRFGCGDDRDERRARVPPRVAAARRRPPVRRTRVDRHGLVDRDRRDGSRHRAGEGRRVESADAARRAAPVADVLPEALAPHAERRHDADPGDGDPAFPHPSIIGAAR